MAQTLLQLTNQAQAELGQSISSSVIGNTTLSVIQQLYLINGLGQELVREWDWQWLDKEYRFYTVAFQYTGDVTSGSTTLSNLSSTTGLTATPTYFAVTGPGIPQDTYLVSVNGGAGTAVMSNEATTSGTTVTLNFM